MRNPLRLLTTLLLVAIANPVHGQSFLGIGLKVQGAYDRLRAEQALGALETDAKGAEEYFALKRRVPGTKDVPVERYAVAQHEAAKLPLHGRSSVKKASSLSAQTTTFSGASTALSSPSATGTSSELSTGLSDWTSVGPTNIPGRTRTLVFAPDNPNIMYTAGVAGGVWKSIDHGENWFAVGDAMGNIAVTVLAINPANSNIIYAGTGEGFFNYDAVRGLGVFKSTDAGATWTNITPANNPAWSYVNDIVISRRDPNALYVATNQGIFRSLDAGTTFTLLQGLVGVCQDLELRKDVTAADYLFAVCNANRASVFRSKDASVPVPNWEFLVGGGTAQRAALAIAPSSPNVVYAVFSSASANAFGTLDSVMRSNTFGDNGTWVATTSSSDPNKLNRSLLSNPLAAFASNCSAGSDFTIGQGWYDLAVAVDPVNPDRVWVGGVDLFRSDDGGHNWGLASYWWADPGTPSYAHADQHAIVFDPQYDASANRVIWATSDGGVFRSSDATAGTATGLSAPCSASNTNVAWMRKSVGLQTTQFYGGAVFSGGARYFGGTQDNGTVLGTDIAGANGWSEILGGDGGKAAIDPSNESTIYAEFPQLDIQKSVDGGANWTPISRTIPDYGLFVTPFVLDPVAPQRLWTGGFYMWRSDNGGANWNRAGVITPGQGFVSAVAISPVDSNHVIAGLSDGYIVSTATGLTNDSSSQWTITVPRFGFVSSIAFDPVDASTAYVTYSSFNSNTYSDAHVYKTTDLGATWQSADGNGEFKLPDIPAHSVAVDPFVPTDIYVGTDLGVFATTDGGQNWSRENTGFFNVVTEALVLRRNSTEADLFAFTHGRGVYRTTLRPMGLVVMPSVLNFGDQAVGVASSALNINIRNVSGATITINSATASAEFAVSQNNCGSLAAGATCTIAVTHTPAAQGKRTGTLQILHTGPQSPATVELRGNGVVSAIIDASTAPLDFGTVFLGDGSALLRVTVRNIGNKVPNFLGFSVVDGGPYFLSDDCPSLSQLQPGASCTLSVRFAPNVAGSYPRKLRVEGGTFGAVYKNIDIPITGLGITSPVSISNITPAKLLFGSGATEINLTGMGFNAGTTVFVNGTAHTIRFASSSSIFITLTAQELAKPVLLSVVANSNGYISKPAFFPVAASLDLQTWHVSYDRFSRLAYVADLDVTNGKYRLSKFDPVTGSRQQIATGISGVFGFSEDGRYLYLSSNSDVQRMDLRTNIIETVFTVPADLYTSSVGYPRAVIPIQTQPESLAVAVSYTFTNFNTPTLFVFTAGVQQPLTSKTRAGESLRRDADTGLIYGIAPNIPWRKLQALPQRGIQVAATADQTDYVQYDYAADRGTLYTVDSTFDATTLRRSGKYTPYGDGYGTVIRVNAGTNSIVTGGIAFSVFDLRTLDQIAKWSLQTSQYIVFDLFNSGHSIVTGDSFGGLYAFRIPSDVAPANELTPAIDSLSPAIALQNVDNVIVTIKGSNFTGWSQVRFNGAVRETKWIDRQTLKAWIPFTDLANLGSAQITVANAQGVTSSAATFTVITPPVAGQTALSVSLKGLGQGSVVGSPGIDCGQTCVAVLPQGTSVTLRALPAAGSTFAGWGGACSGTDDCTLTTDTTQKVDAYFAVNAARLDVQRTGTGAGKVTSLNGEIDCGTSCAAVTSGNTIVQLQAQSAARSAFEGWEGDCSGSGPCRLLMTTSHSVSARFRKVSDQTLVRSDFDGDGKADLTVWRPSSGTWFTVRSQDGSNRSQQWGAVINGVQDIPVPGDYDGDGKTDYAVWRPSEGMWYILPSSAPGTYISKQWGAVLNGVQDIPVPGDYDGDGKTDIAVWRPSEGTWYILPSSAPGTYKSQQWGAVLNGVQDVPVVGDFDGDGKADIAVWRPSNGTWYIRPSGTPGTSTSQQWGAVIGGVADRPVVADYDGDGKSDMAVWRPSEGTWYILPSSAPSTYVSKQWGAVIGGVEDIPVAADYDGDGKADFAVWRPGNGTWYTLPSATAGSHTEKQWGTTGDIPSQRQK